MKFRKGDAVLATSKKSSRQVQFRVPRDNMCNKMLTRYLVLYLGETEEEWLFTAQ